MPKEVTNVPRAGSRPIRPMPTNEELAQGIQALDATLSEVLVLLYHVVQANHTLLEELREQRPRTQVLSGSSLPEFKSRLYAVTTERSTGQ